LSEANVATVTGDALEILTVSFTQPATILKEALKRIKDAWHYSQIIKSKVRNQNPTYNTKA
jgi:hypothetical protein